MPSEIQARHVALVANTTWNIANFRMGLVNALLQEAYRVSVIAPTDDSVAVVTATGARHLPLQLLARKGTNPVSDYRLLRELRSLYQEHEVDVALQYTIKPVIYGTLAARKSATRTISTLTGLGYAFLSRGVVNQVVLRLYRLALRYAERIYFQNSDDRALFESLKLIPAGIAGVIPGSGINLGHFEVAAYPREEATFDVLFIGRLLFDKGVVELIEAARQLRTVYPSVRLHLVGAVDAGNPAAVAQAQLDEWTALEWVTYHGEVDDTRPFIRTAHVVVLPSYREGLPRVMLEAMAMARPTVTTDVPGCRDTVVEGETGFLTAVKNADSLREGLQQMIDLPRAERERMGLRGRKRAEEVFAEPIIIQHYLSALRELQ